MRVLKAGEGSGAYCGSWISSAYTAVYFDLARLPDESFTVREAHHGGGFAKIGFVDNDLVMIIGLCRDLRRPRPKVYSAQFLWWVHSNIIIV